MRYAVRRVSPVGALFYGLVLGMAGWLLPGAALGWLARSLVLGLRGWLSGWSLAIPLPFGEDLTIDLTGALPLAGVQERLAALSGQDVALFFAIALGTIAAGMLLTGLSAFLGALLYNLFAGLFGGLELSLDALDLPARQDLPRQAPTGATVKTAHAATAPAVAPGPIMPPYPRPEPARPARSAPAAWLALTSDAGERWALRDDATHIGSSPENDIVLPGLAIHHAEIRRESGRYLVYDLGSRRTWVDEAQVAAVHMLKNGSRLQLGRSEFIVHISAAGSAAENAR